MIKRYLPFLLLFSVVVSCSKGKLETRPSIKIKSINGNTFLPGQDMLVTLEYDDKEGDLGGGLITYIRNRLNIRPITDPSSNDRVDTIANVIPDFPKTSTGDIELLIPGFSLDEDPFDNDTMVFKIFVTDVAGNVSDTVTTEQIVEIQ